MCGIAGVSGVFRSVDLCAARDALAHRGPDDAGIYEDGEGRIGLVHTRLSILDLSEAGQQPMQSANKNIVIVFNGEIYNFRDLRSELKADGYVFFSNSDTEVLLNLYQASNGNVPEMLRRLNGIFAFAVWDAEKRALLLARDGFGVKPLYFSCFKGSFAFASEIKALLPLVPDFGGVDPQAIERYLTFLWCPGEGTPVKAIKKLGPGEAMWVRDGEILERMVWYRLPQFRSLPKLAGAKEAIVGTTRHLREAVARQMGADVPVGAFLSGGLDSSSVVAFAREQNPNIVCFTLQAVGGQDEGMTDDLPYARRVAAHLGVQLEVVKVDGAAMANDLVAMVRQLDEPLADPAPLNAFYISRLARASGVKVLLSGVGGDDLFTGYRRHLALNMDPFFQWLPMHLRAAMEKAGSSLSPASSLGRRLQKLSIGLSLNGDARLINYFRWANRSDLMRLFSADFRASLADTNAEAPFLNLVTNLPEDLSRGERMLMLEQRFFLADHNLIYTDKMSMAAGVEVRVPFLDPDLVDFASRVPHCYKQRLLEGKWVLKKAMEPFLPRDVIYRPKTGFGAPLRRWMRHELRPCISEYLSCYSLTQRGIFDSKSVSKLVADNDAGRVDGAYTLFSLLCIEIWCRFYIDREEGKGLR